MNDAHKRESGFTLIEVMIVIAIIGILAAIAIPNFIAYRDKAYCTHAENDADNIIAALASYFATPAHNSLILPINIIGNQNSGGLQNIINGITFPLLNGANTATITGTLPNLTITVHDVDQRCPQSYQAGSANWNNWFYTKTLQ